MAYSPVSIFGVLRVYTEPLPVINSAGWRVYDGDGEAVAWELSSLLRVRKISHRSGAAPSEALLEVLGKDAAPLHAPGGFQVGEGLDQNGNPTGAIVRPTACGIMEQVKVCWAASAEADPDDDTVLFIGLVTKIRPDWKSEIIEVLCSDFRWLWRGCPVHGGTFENPALETHGFLADVLPIFNPKGLPNRYTETSSYPAFILPGHEYAGYWTRGHIWNWLRYHFSTNVNAALVPTGHYMDWPEVVTPGHGAALFGNNVWPDFHPGGQELGKVLEHLVKRRGGHDFWLKPNASGSKGTLDLYGTAPDTFESIQTRLSLKRGTPGGSQATEQAEVLAGSPAWDADRTFLEVYGLGAVKRYDVTLDTVAGTLVNGWTLSQQTAWLALSSFEKKKQYKSILCRYLVPDDMDWAGEFGWLPADSPILRDRRLSAMLLSGDLSTEGADGQPVRLRAQIWRSLDAGANWEEMPKTFGGVAPAQNGLGVELCDAVRDKFWIWDGDLDDPTLYDLRVTVSIEADQRLHAPVAGQADPPLPATVVTGSEWPQLRRLVLDDNFKYEARRHAMINATGSESPFTPVLDGGAPQPFGFPAGDPPVAVDDVIRNDAAQQAAANAALIDQLGRLGREGPITVKGLRLDIVPGCILENVTGGGADRPTEAFDSAIRRVDYDFGDKPITTIYVESD